MTTIAIKPGDALNLVAARVFPGGDVRRFSELLDANPDLDVFGDLPEGFNLELPSTEQIESYAKPVLSRVASSLGGAKGFLGQVEDTIANISGKLPPELQGYAKDALELVDEANGAIGAVESVLDDAEEEVRSYAGQGSNLVSWLLSGKS